MAKKRTTNGEQQPGPSAKTNAGKKRRATELTREQTEIVNTVGPIPRVSDNAMAGSIVASYRKNVDVDMTFMYKATGDGSSLTTMEYIKAKGDNPALKRKYVSRATNFVLPARLGPLSQSLSVQFSDDALRAALVIDTADIPNAIRVLPSENAPLISRSYPFEAERVTLEDEQLIDTYIKPVYDAYLGLPQTRGYLMEAARRMKQTFDITEEDIEEAKLDKLSDGGYTFPCVAVVHSGGTHYIPLPGTLVPTYEQNATSLKWNGGDAVTYNALIEYREALLGATQDPDIIAERLRLESVLKSFFHIVNVYRYGVGNVTGLSGRVSFGARHAVWAEDARESSAQNPHSVANRFLNDHDHMIATFRIVMPFARVEFTNPHPAYAECPAEWIYYEESQPDGTFIQRGLITFTVTYPNGKTMDYRIPTFKQNGASDPGYPFDTKQGAHPDSDLLGVKKRDVEMQGLIMASVLADFCDMHTEADLENAVLGTMYPYPSVSEYLEHIRASPDFVNMPAGCLAFLRNVKLKEKKEVMTLEKLRTKSRNIYVTPPPINILASEFTRLPKYAIMSEAKGHSKGTSWLGYSPAHGGCSLLFRMAEKSRSQPRRPILRCCSDNVIIFEAGESVSIDASSCESSLSPFFIRQMCLYQGLEFWGMAVDDYGRVTDGGAFSRAAASFCINVFPHAVGNSIGIVKNTMADVKGMASGTPGTAEFNSEYVGSACHEIEEHYHQIGETAAPGTNLMIDSYGNVSPRFLRAFEDFGIKMKVTAAAVTNRSSTYPHTASFEQAWNNPYTLRTSGSLVTCGFLGFDCATIELGPPGERVKFAISQLEADRAMFALSFAKLQDDQRPPPNSDMKANQLALNKSLIRLFANNSVSTLMPLDPAIREAFRISNARIVREITELYSQGSAMEAESATKIAANSKKMISHMIGEFDDDLIGDPDITDYSQVVATLENYQLPYYTSVMVMLPLHRTNFIDPRTNQAFMYSHACMLFIREVFADPDLKSNLAEWLPLNVIHDIRDAFPDWFDGVDDEQLQKIEKMSQRLKAIFDIQGQNTGPSDEEYNSGQEGAGTSAVQLPEPAQPVWAD